MYLDRISFKLVDSVIVMNTFFYILYNWWRFDGYFMN